LFLAKFGLYVADKVRLYSFL